MSAVVAQRIGHGPQRVLVLHGWFGPSVFDGFFDSFDPDQFDIAIVHNSGYGAARGQTPALDITELAEQQMAVADELGWEAFDIIGHSYGGAAGLRIASLAPQRVGSLVAICPVMPSGFDDIAVANCGATAETGPAYLASYAKGPDAADGPGMIIAGLDPVLAKDPVAYRELIDATYAAMNEEAFQQYFAVWTGASFVDDVVGLNTRSLFIVAESDPFAAVNYVTPTVEIMAPGAVRVEVLPGGHFLTVSGDRAEVATMITDFLTP